MKIRKLTVRMVFLLVIGFLIGILATFLIFLLLLVLMNVTNFVAFVVHGKEEAFQKYPALKQNSWLILSADIGEFFHQLLPQIIPFLIMLVFGLLIIYYIYSKIEEYVIANICKYIGKEVGWAPSYKLSVGSFGKNIRSLAADFNNMVPLECKDDIVFKPSDFKRLKKVSNKLKLITLNPNTSETKLTRATKTIERINDLFRIERFLLQLTVWFWEGVLE